MPTRRFEREALAQLLVAGCAVVFGVCVLFEHAQAQPGYVPPPTPLPPPVFNPSNPGTVPQPSYQPLTPSTPSITPPTPNTLPSEVRSRVRDEAPSTTARSEPTPEIRTVHRHHHYRGHYAGPPTLGSFDCSYFGWCVRISPPYAYYQRYGWYRY